MINWLKNYINSRDYSEGFFSKKLKVRIGILILALIFLAVAKVYDNRQAEKYNKLEQAAAAVKERERKESGVDNGDAPDFTVKNFEQEDVTLSSRFGKPIVLSFWATWSNDSQRTLPVFDDACDKYGEDVDFMMVNLTDGSQDTVSSVTKFLDNAGYGFPVYFDIEHYAEIEYNVLSIPLTAFIDKNGQVVDCVTVFMPADELDAKIEALLK